MGPLWLILGISLAHAASFNTSVVFSVNGWSGMILLDEGFRLDVDTGTVERADKGTINMNWYFVGTAYNASGTLRPGPAYNESILGVNLRLGQEPLPKIYLGRSEGNATGLGSTSNLPLKAYTIAFKALEDVEVTFESLSVRLPVLTQAPTFADMQFQTHPAILKGNDLSESFSVHKRQSQKYLLNSSDDDPSVWDPQPNLTFSNSNDGVLLEKGTELSYTIPVNTTLINVTATVGVGQACYAVLEPPPDWWDMHSIPLAFQGKPQIMNDQTMFMLPVDPTFKYNLTLGPYGNKTMCHVGAVTSYSFFYDAPPPPVEEAPPADEAPPEPTGDKQQGQQDTPEGGSNVGTIAGGVVGGVCGLALLLLALWYIWRRRRGRSDTPLQESSGQTNHTVVTPYSVPVTHSGRSSDGKLLDPVSANNDRVDPALAGPVVAQQRQTEPVYEYAEDYEDAIGPQEPVLLPPRYREAWGEGAPGESSSEGGVARPSGSGGTGPRTITAGDGRANQLKHELINTVDAKTGR